MVRERGLRRRRTAGRAARTALAALAAAVLLWAADASAAGELAVTVAPARAFVGPGAELMFTATVTDEAGRRVSADLSWSVIPVRVGRIGGDGLFRAADAAGRGIVRVVARRGDATGSGHAVVEVGTRPPERLLVAVTPADAAAMPGEEVQFQALVTDPASGAAVDADLRWVVLPAEVGSVTGDGLFTAGGRPGAGRVAARAALDGREGVGDARVVVGAPEHGSLDVTVSPPRARLTPGDEVLFQATVVDGEGAPVAVPVEWSVVPGDAGTVSADGRFTAGADEMDGRVVASAAGADGPARGFAAVEVRRPGASGVRVHVHPRQTAVPRGGDVQFAAVVLGPGGEELDVPVEWRVTPDWFGTIAPSGLLTVSEEFPEPPAGGHWRGTVTASVRTSEGTASDAARVLVPSGAQSARLRIRPARPVVAPGDEVQFEADVVGAGDPNGWTTEWAVFPPDLGTITPDGLFTANPAFGDPNSPEFGPHEGAVGARATLEDGTTLSDLAHVLVRIPGRPVRVIVRPVVAVVPPTESVQFTAVVLGPDGEPMTVPVTWDVEPARVGSISADGLFTAADVPINPNEWQRPIGRVTATVTLGGGQVFRGAAAVVLDLPNPEITVRVSPSMATLAPGEELEFEAEVLDQSGEPVSLPVEWKVADPAVGTITQSGLFTATTLVPPGQTRQTRVAAGVTANGRVYVDLATVRVTRGAGE